VYHDRANRPGDDRPSSARDSPSTAIACFRTEGLRARGSIDRLGRAERPTRPRTRRLGATVASRAIDRSRVRRGRASPAVARPRPDAATVDAVFLGFCSARAKETDSRPRLSLFRPLTRAPRTFSLDVSSRQFVADGVFFAELNEMLIRELAEDGYSGVEVRVTPMRTEIIIRATRTQSVLGEKGRRIRELTSLVQKRFGFAEGSVELYAEKVANRGLCAIAQAESLRYKLLGGLAVRRACYGVLRFIMENGAKGCEVVVSGKLRGQRGKAMKFKDGYMISSGNPVREYIDSSVRHVLLRQGCVGIKVKIMLDWDPKGRTGPSNPIPDTVTIHNPKDEDESGVAKPFVGKELEM
jgi:small subunit ribosomal protein S3e